MSPCGAFLYDRLPCVLPSAHVGAHSEAQGSRWSRQRENEGRACDTCDGFGTNPSDPRTQLGCLDCAGSGRAHETCEHCDKPIATLDDGEMHVDDPRVATLCWAREENGDICPVLAAKNLKAEIAAEGPEYDKYEDR